MWRVSGDSVRFASGRRCGTILRVTASPNWLARYRQVEERTAPITEMTSRQFRAELR
jgi:hypothetical protein